MSFRFQFDADVDLSEAGEDCQQFLSDVSDLEIGVGFNAKSGSYPDGTSVTMVAAWNELGTENIPSRPFMRQMMEKEERNINNYLKRYLKMACTGDLTTEAALDKIGNYLKYKIKESIREGEYEPNAPSTIAKKGSSVPLIDTRQMYRSVIYEVTGKTE